MTRYNRWAAALAAVSLGLVAACQADSTLGVSNTDQPDVGRILSTPDGIDAVLRPAVAGTDLARAAGPEGPAAAQ